MDVSFSANTWKHLEIQNLDLKLEEQFYASTPYNLNDFKQTSKPPCAIFQSINSNFLHNQNSLKKELIKKENASLGIIVTFLYEFFSQIKNQIQKKNNNPEIKTKIPSSTSHLKVQMKKDGQEEEGQTDRKILSPEKSDKKIKNQEFEVLKKIKLKVYEIDLCKLKGVPNKFMKYYNNNLLKKIIFQYLSKALYNMSLVQILLQSNEVLCFALSLVSQSLMAQKDRIYTFNQNRIFYEEAYTFLQHFDSNDDLCILLNANSEGLLPSLLSTQSKVNGNKGKTTQNNFREQSFMNFVLTQTQMKSKYYSFKQDGDQGNKRYLLTIEGHKKPIGEKIASTSKQKSKFQTKEVNSPSKQAQKHAKTVKDGVTTSKQNPSSKSIKFKSQKRAKNQYDENSWMKYLGCLKYFFSDSPKN